MNFNRQTGVDYHAPQTTSVDLQTEGLLCASFGNEGFMGMGQDGKAPVYGEGVENNGWH